MTTPVPLILNLWSLGHTARDIAERVGLPDADHVYRVIDHARDIGDPRAVLHKTVNGKMLGNGELLAGLVGEFEVVAIVSASAQRSHCRHGHEYTRENTYLRRDGVRYCRSCHIKRLREHRRK